MKEPEPVIVLENCPKCGSGLATSVKGITGRFWLTEDEDAITYRTHSETEAFCMFCRWRAVFTSTRIPVSDGAIVP